MLRDSLGGKSFGKMFMGISVVSLARLRPASIGDSLLRNSVFLVGLIPFAGVAAILILNAIMALQILSGKAQRLGDRFANTMVIDDSNLNDFIGHVGSR